MQSTALDGKTPSGFAALVVTYFPAEIFITVIREIARQFPFAAVIDNGSGGKSKQYLEAAQQYSNVLVRFNETNKGLGEALNAGVEECARRGAQWVATFDQDTLIPFDFTKKMSAAIAECDNDPRIGMLSCAFADSGKVYQSSSRRTTALASANLEETLEAITSGSVVNAKILRRLGGFEESFFIDYLDHEIVLRMTREGYKVVRVPAVVINHRIGNARAIRILGVRFSASNHPPARLFTIFRNVIVVVRRYWRVAPAHIAKLVLREGFRTIKVIFFEAQKKRKLLAILLGCWKGLSAKPGDVVTLDELLHFKS